jgi:beta-phosphoglucomutase
VTDPPGIRAILFDADGVIVDSEKIWDAAQAEFSRRRGIPYEREKLKPRLAGRSQADAIAILKAEYHLPGAAAALAAERLELVRRELAKGVEFVAGFPDFFARVRADYQTCVATAMPEELLALVDGRLGLSGLFGGRIFSLRAAGCRSKPHPDLFLHAACQLGAPPARCLVIEDAPNGIEAARAAGMKCVALTTTFARPQLAGADRVVDSFAEIDPTAL